MHVRRNARPARGRDSPAPELAGRFAFDTFSIVELPVVVEAGMPIVVLVTPPAVDLAWIERQQREFARIFARGERYAVITYSGFVVSIPGAKERRALTEWADEPSNRANQKRLCVGASTQLGSAVQRAFMTALYWMWDPPAPQGIHATLDEAIDWCCDRLAAENVPAPPREVLKGRIHGAIDALHARAKGA